MATRSGSVSIHVYVAAVVAAGLFAVAVSVGGAFDLGFLEAPEFWVFAALTFLGELWPMKVRRRDEGGVVTTSSTFAFAILLTSGLFAAVLAQGLATLCADALHRKGTIRSSFNAGQYVVSLVGASWVLAVDGVAPFASGGTMAVSELPAVLVAGVVMFILQNLLTGGAVAIASGQRWVDTLRGDLAFNSSTAGVLMTLSPILVVVAERALPLIPLLLGTVTALYKSASVSLQKEHEALHDLLTDLPNRRLFRDRVEAALADARRTGDPVGVIVVDLDRFKEINDTLGHHIGDLVLQQIGPRLRNSVREIDTLARLGGDEFGVLLRGVTDANEAEQIAARVVAALDRPVIVEGFPLKIDASVGVAVYPDHGEHFDLLMQRADAAMYVAKRDQLGAALYSPLRDEQGMGRMALLGQLREAIDSEQLLLHYQPKADMRTGELRGVEALVRWQHPEYGLVSPDEFISLAEHTELIGPLTRTILDMAIGQCSLWHREGHLITVAVNLSVQNLYDQQFPSDVRRLLATWDVDASWLELEITENTVMADPIRARGVLEELAALGLRVAIDDFGTGYSSLAHLRQLPVSEIKIDRSFVTNMSGDENDAVIVRSIIDLARNLGLDVVAEGVETLEVWEMLAELGCHHAQGFYLCRPIAAAGLTALLRDTAGSVDAATGRPTSPHAARSDTGSSTGGTVESLAAKRARRAG
jgi:diguanylate cyclase (GGDEF)-like protein